MLDNSVTFDGCQAAIVPVFVSWVQGDPGLVRSATYKQAVLDALASQDGELVPYGFTSFLEVNLAGEAIIHWGEFI